MSRIGRLPIPVPEGVKINIDGSDISVSGPKGDLRRVIPSGISVAIQDKYLVVTRASDSREHRSLHGLTRSLVANMVEGVSKGFEKGLEITGVGYRVEKSGEKLMLRLGLSHPVEVSPVEGITFGVEGTNRIKVLGINREIVGQIAANIRRIRPPDKYKGKGIRYAGEKIRLKPGKAGKAVGKG
jgi:large subunit ribosomal protein L6